MALTPKTTENKVANPRLVVNNNLKIQSHSATETRLPFVVKDKEARTIPVPKHCLNLLNDLHTYNDVTDQSPFVVLNEQQYKTVRKKWKRYQQQKRHWFNRDMRNNTLSTFKRHLRWAGIDNLLDQTDARMTPRGNFG